MLGMESHIRDLGMNSYSFLLCHDIDFMINRLNSNKKRISQQRNILDNWFENKKEKSYKVFDSYSKK